MKMITLLPADVYQVVTRSTFSDIDRKNIINLYEPILGFGAVSLYLTLWKDCEKENGSNYTHHHLMTLLKVNLEVIKKARETLEAFGLLKTFYKEGSLNNYIYELYSPLSSKEFFSHPILNVVLYNNIGKYEYDKLKEEYKTIRIDTKEYEDISATLEETYISTNNMDILLEEVVGPATLPLNMKDQVDFDFIISSLPKGLVQEKAWNKKMRELINNLAFVYNLDSLKMVELLRTAINEKGYFEKEELRLEARKYYQYQNNGKLPTLIYRTQPEYLKSPTGDTSNRGKIIEVFENTSPYDFLKSKYKGSNPTSRDLKLLEMLLIDIGLTPSVVNVLIDYVLKKNNNRLDSNFVETIAGHWKRAGIETAKDAMAIAEKEHKKYNKKAQAVNPKANIEPPVWFEQNISKEELSQEEQVELESMLQKYR